jgi:hypothetical protein
MSTHPRTDKVSTPHIGFYSCATVPSSFAAELETENESLKKEIETLKIKVTDQSSRIRDLEVSNIRLNNLLCEHGILEYGN